MLNTAEAARFLRVSQASIRRWSDSGLLPGRRVGRRRERRFTEADLAAFMNVQASSQPRTETANIGGISVAAPAHLATFFSSDPGSLRLSLPFLAEGLRLGQPCFLVATDDVLDRYLDALKKHDSIDLDRAMRSGALTVVRFDGDKVDDAVAQLERYFAEALAQRPTLIRLVGEMACVRSMFVSEDEMLRFEEAFEVMYRRYPVLVICQYDARTFDGVVLLRVLKAHPDLFGLRIGTFLN